MGVLVAAWIPALEQVCPHSTQRHYLYLAATIPGRLSIEHGGDWTTWVAYIAAVVLVSAAVARGQAPAQGVTCAALQKAAEGQYDIGECHKN